LVVAEPEKGYGAACLAGIAALPPVDIVAFIDGDHSDFPEDLASLVDPIIAGSADFMLASRAVGEREQGSLTPQQVFGNWLATTLIRLFWRARYTDLGPFRAIAKPALERLAMADRNYGWTVEMQIKAAEHGLRHGEVPARYRRRIGVSKVSGTIKGTLMAGYKILSIIGRHALRRWLGRAPQAGRASG
ncbi:MAG TPA: glycosyltransferase family 2 protein, partial [Hyphomicrobiaceae bacterium]|nr:glycosyltransferase family 2 protein [Hyphomicrobiaceae bacterium]